MQLVGATLVGTLKEVAVDKTWLIVRSHLPEQPDVDVDATLPAIFTLGQAAYLGKKAAGEGPPAN